VAAVTEKIAPIIRFWAQIPPLRRTPPETHGPVLAGGAGSAAGPELAFVPELAGVWMFGPLPLPVPVVVSLPPGLASLVVVSAFYSGSVVGVERAA
jgi:hypothetical protein